MKMGSVLFDNNMTSLRHMLESVPVSTWTQAPVDPWEGSDYRHLLISEEHWHGRDYFNSTLDYVEFWDDFLTWRYTQVEEHYAELRADHDPWSKTAALLTYVYEIPITFLLSMFGFFSNIVVILVFYRLGVKSDSCTVILTCIAVSDLIYCFFIFLSYSLMIPTTLGYSKGAHKGWEMNLEAIHEALKVPRFVFIEFNCLATAYLALERMVSIAYPFHVKRYFNPKRSFFIVIALFVVSLGLEFPGLVSSKLIWFYDSSGRRRTLMLIETDWISYDIYWIMAIVKIIGMRSLCVVVIVVFNTIIIVKVRIAEKRKRAMTSSSSSGNDVNNMIASSRSADGAATTSRQNHRSPSSRESKLTRMMTAVSAMFLICYTPGIALTIIASFELSVDMRASYTIAIGTTFLELTNSCFSILIYYGLSSKFNKMLKDICGCCNRRE